MFTRHDVIRRLEDIEKEIKALKEAFQEEWEEEPALDATRLFLEKCRGWEDSRSTDEIIAEIYQSRTTSDRGANLFGSKAER